MAKSVALADRAVDRQILALERPIDPVSDARGILPPVVPGETVEREQVAVLKVDGTRILVGDVHVARRRRQYQLDARDEPLDAARYGPDEGPFDVGRERTDGAAVPA